MSRYYGGWAPYVPVEERRRKAEREMEKLRKKGTVVSPVKIEGRKITSTFWGTAWCDNLESYHDYENRLPRGRTYVRNGSVVDLQIAPREVTAIVSGSSLYKVKVTIAEVAKSAWKSICTDCSGGIDSLVELLQGRFSKGVMERMCRQGAGLFPKPSEIRFSCSCPDGASMCKHVAAVMYGVGSRLDARPELLFRLRAVNENDLVANIGALPMAKAGPAPGKVLETDDMAALFGLDMGGEAEDVTPVQPIAPVVAMTAKPASTVKKAAASKGVAAVRPAAPAKKGRAMSSAPIGQSRPDVAVVQSVAAAKKAGVSRTNGAPLAARKPEPQPVEWWKPGALNTNRSGRRMRVAS